MNLNPRPAAMAAVLTCVAGYVDSIGYLDLGQIYVANMSGNSVALGIHSAWLDWPQVVKHGWPIFSFVIGLIISRLILTWGEDGRRKSAISFAMIVEGIGLAGFLAVHSGAAGVFLVASAMGVQAAAVSKFDGVTVYTCFVTGSLVKMSENLAGIIWVFLASLRRPPHRFSISAKAAVAAPGAAGFVWFAADWTAYAIGAIAGTLALGSFGIRAIWAALAVIAIFIFMGFRSPAMLRQVR